MSYQQNLAQLFWRALEDPEFLQSIKSHKRYNFRLIAILSSQIGLFFNILAVCLVRNKVLNGLAFLPNNEDDIESHAGTGTKITDGETTARTQKPQEDV
ncbi:MAG: hypothetical protein L6R35_002088 [Caloplaca aegaea]|nr:MAG: hypothetical protein L6R35_002088 [Caloplaca aegaea]